MSIKDVFTLVPNDSQSAWNAINLSINSHKIEFTVPIQAVLRTDIASWDVLRH